MSFRSDSRLPEDVNNVNISDAWEITYWTRYFGVSETKLKDTVKIAGTDKEKIKRYLKPR